VAPVNIASADGDGEIHGRLRLAGAVSGGSEVTMARKQPDDYAPAARPACKVVTREKDRWRRVRDPRGEPVCVAVCTRGAVEVVRRLPRPAGPSRRTFP
jgi:hypothetical protein